MDTKEQQLPGTTPPRTEGKPKGQDNKLTHGDAPAKPITKSSLSSFNELLLKVPEL